MEQSSSHPPTGISLTRFDLGTFVGFREPATPEIGPVALWSTLDLDHWFTECELDHSFTATEVINQKQLRPGILFRPAGDHPGVTLVFEGFESVTSNDLCGLIRLLHEMGGDSPANFLKIRHAMGVTLAPIASLTVARIEAVMALVYSGTDPAALRRQAEAEILPHFGSKARRTWQREFPTEELESLGSILDSPDLLVSDLTFANASALHVGLRLRSEACRR